MENPLAQFNHTVPTKEGILELVKTINNSLGESALKESVLLKVVETNWPQFENSFKEILVLNSGKENIKKREDSNILLEVLSTVRGLDKRVGNISDIAILNSEKTILDLNPNYLRSIRDKIRKMLESGLPAAYIIAFCDAQEYPRIVAREEIVSQLDYLREKSVIKDKSKVEN